MISNSYIDYSQGYIELVPGRETSFANLQSDKRVTALSTNFATYFEKSIL
jgi:hypothetical protein